MKEDSGPVIQEQIRYYSELAAEYDATTKLAPEHPLAVQVMELQKALTAFAPRGEVLEIACGTGSWTRLLVEYASELTALDASGDMLALCRQKLGDAAVRYVEADVFAWKPESRYDAVFFANWLSHVPPKRFDEFWSKVADLLTPTGRVFFLDEETPDVRGQEEFLDEARALVRRRLPDGRTYDIVKVYYDASRLGQRLRALGWDVQVHSTGDLYWGDGCRSKATAR
jgi:ubiquinone/menaquinone biosynthesis C-methylase UbiE